MKQTWLSGVLWVLGVLLVSAVRAEASYSTNVFVVLEENHSYQQVVGDSSMPYFNSLIAEGALGVNYFADAHPSLPNYLWLSSGSADKVTKDACYKSLPIITANNAVRELNLFHLSWRGYFEGLPAVGSMVCNFGFYAGRHNPFPHYSDVRNSLTQQQNQVPLARLALDISANTFAHYNWIVPNVCDDMHGQSNCTNGCTSAGLSACYRAADNWLAAHIKPLLAKPLFQPGGSGLLIIVWDEGTTNLHGGGQVAVTFVGPKVRHGWRSTIFYQHQSLLRTMLENVGVTSFPQGAATAPYMEDFFSS